MATSEVRPPRGAHRLRPERTSARAHPPARAAGLNEQIKELREVIELPLINPELFVRVGLPQAESSRHLDPQHLAKSVRQHKQCILMS